MYLVAGVTGHVGKVVAETLLARGKKVRALVRSAQKGEALKAKGAEIVVGDIGDPAGLAKALAGVEGAFLLVPPDMQSDNLKARGEKIASAWVQALNQAKVPHVVFLSSIGAQLPEGNGPIVQPHVVERELRKLTATRCTFVRAAYFMENVLSNLQPMKEQGMLPVFGGGEAHKFPMVATRDIGEVATEALLSPPQTTEIIELEGPEPYSYQDAAKTFGQQLKRNVTAQALPLEKMAPTLMGFGISKAMAEGYQEMTAGFGQGKIGWEGGKAHHRKGKVTLEQVAKSAVGA